MNNMSTAHKCDNCGKYWAGESKIQNRPKGETMLDNCNAKFEIIGGVDDVWNGGDLCDECYLEALRQFVDEYVATKVPEEG